MTDESLSPRWSEGKEESEDKESVLWCCISRGQTILVSVTLQDDPKIVKVADRLMRKDPKTGWDYYTYAVQSQKRLVQAAKFAIWEKVNEAVYHDGA